MLITNFTASEVGRALISLSMHGCSDNARQMQDEVASALRLHGWSVKLEMPCKSPQRSTGKGRIDIYASHPGSGGLPLVALIECDRRAPRKHSVQKLRAWPARDDLTQARIIMLRRPDRKHLPKLPKGIDSLMFLDGIL